MALMFGCYFKFGAGPKARSGASGSGGPTAKRVNSERSPGFSAHVGLIVPTACTCSVMLLISNTLLGSISEDYCGCLKVLFGDLTLTPGAWARTGCARPPRSPRGVCCPVIFDGVVLCSQDCGQFCPSSEKPLLSRTLAHSSRRQEGSSSRTPPVRGRPALQSSRWFPGLLRAPHLPPHPDGV